MPTDRKTEIIITDLYQSFRDRCSEVSRYIEFVAKISEHRATKLASVDHAENLIVIENYEITRELTKTLRANSYLVLYNLVEATMTTGIDAIHKAVHSNNLCFEDLSEKLKEITLTHFKRAIANSNKQEVFYNEEHPIKLAMVYLGYDKENIFSGNIDVSLIRKVATKYGFSSPDPNRKGRDIATNLKEIRDKRNGLAHGRLSFEQCGENTAHDYLQRVEKQTVIYLRAILWSISAYLRNDAYRIAIDNTEADKTVAIPVQAALEPELAVEVAVQIA